MKKTVDNVLKGNDINNNLKKYFKEYKKLTNEYALVHFALNYYTYYSMVMGDDELDKDSVSYIARINKIVENINNIEKKDESIGKLLDIRNEIISKVEAFTVFVDKFYIYEYALNRVEYRFKDIEENHTYTDEDFTRKLMEFMFADDDQMMISLNVKTVMSQLPIRYTKSKFFDMISRGVGLYSESDKESFDDFLYMIRTASTLTYSKETNNEFPEIQKVFSMFEEVDFKNISKEDYEKLRLYLEKVTDYITDTNDLLTIVIEVANDLLSVLYTVDEMDSVLSKNCMDIINNTNKLFTGKNDGLSETEIEEMFDSIVGIQERIHPQLVSYNITYEISENYKDVIEKDNLLDEFNIVSRLTVLTSDNFFMDFDKEQGGILTKEYMDSKEKELIDEYTQFFKNNERIINRAVMAMAINELPMLYSTMDEIQDMIFNCLSSCTNKEEKAACIEILEDIIKD